VCTKLIDILCSVTPPINQLLIHTYARQTSPTDLAAHPATPHAESKKDALGPATDPQTQQIPQDAPAQPSRMISAWGFRDTKLKSTKSQSQVLLRWAFQEPKWGQSFFSLALANDVPSAVLSPAPAAFPSGCLWALHVGQAGLMDINECFYR